MPSDSEEDMDDINWDDLKSITTFDGLNRNDNDQSDGNVISNSGVIPSTKILTNPLSSSTDSFIKQITNHATTPVSLLVESLVLQLCTMLDSDPQRSSNLYKTICEQLHEMNLIDNSYSMGEFEVMRSQYQRALYQLVTIARGQDLPIALQSVWPLTQPAGMDWSRYYRDFDEISFIAGGGFGSVFKARHKLDGTMYAVKKINIRAITITRVLSHLAEVKTLASLNHANVVPYKAAWLEPLLTENPTNLLNSRNRATEENGGGNFSETDVDTGENGSFAEEDQQSTTNADYNEIDDDDDDFTNDQANLMKTKFNNKFEDSSDFIEFKSESIVFQSESNTKLDISTSISQNAVVRKIITKKKPTPSSDVVDSLNKPHVNLKWATLYIQMALCHMTLRDWLDKRNKCESFLVFYRDFRISCGSPLCLPSPEYENQSESPTNTNNNYFDKDDDLPTQTEIAIEICRQLVCGLDYIHARGIIHHDIKPSNVFITMEKNGDLIVLLGDFGLACPLQDNHSGKFIGTVTYAAPEQLNGKCHPKSDVYSLGIILIELLLTLKTDMERIKTFERGKKLEFPEEIPSIYVPLLKSLLKNEPNERPTTNQILEILRQINDTNEKSTEHHEIIRLNSELQKLRGSIDIYDTNDELKIELEQKNAKLHEKDEEIANLKLKLIEMKHKDKEILKLKKLLKIHCKEMFDNYNSLSISSDSGSIEEVINDKDENTENLANIKINTTT